MVSIVYRSHEACVCWPSVGLAAPSLGGLRPQFTASLRWQARLGDSKNRFAHVMITF